MLLLTAPAIFAMCLINSAAGFILLRLLTGLSLSSFVACQYWCISMYNVRVVGTVTSLAAGLGNAGAHMFVWYKYVGGAVSVADC